jgi:amino acid adenylation domain-containing protein
MKLSELTRPVPGYTELETLYNELNAVKTEYPLHSNIVTEFMLQAKQHPSRIAVKDSNSAITYRDLDKQSNRVAGWLREKAYGDEAAVAVYLDKSVEMIIHLLAILKAGCTYFPVNTEYPYERVKQMLIEANVRMVITGKKFIRDVNRLQWECPVLDSYLCIDSTDVYTEEEPRNEWMNKAFWEYIGETAADEIEAGGWVDSFTGEPFAPEVMNEYGENIVKKLAPYLDKGKKVLEIGCASGITMFRIASYVESYVGTDISAVIIEKNRSICAQQGISNIRLQCLEAENIDQLDEKDFDIVIINSVVQAFNGHNYLRRIIQKSISLLKENGLLFLGDIMDQDLKETMINDLISYSGKNGNGRSKLDFSGELFVTRSFFDDLVYEISAVTDVQHSLKIHTIPCELTRYRYDTIITINKNNQQPEQRGKKRKNQFDNRSFTMYADELPVTVIKPDQLAYIIFTSGSTGIPKGVLIEHTGVLRAVKNINYVHPQQDDVWMQTCNIAFDASCFEIFGALLNGNTLCLTPIDTLMDTGLLEEYIRANNITIMAIVAPLFHELAANNPGVFRELRTVIVGGDSIVAKHANAVKEYCPATRLVNVYGPTENAIASTSFEIDGPYNVIPIGRPVSNTRAYILNGNRQLQPAGIAGELCVAGDGLSRGYLNDPEMTDRKFPADPFVPGQRMYLTGDRARLNADGNIEFLGRKDGQVKIRGNRIELFEIETALRQLPAVKNAVVTAPERNDGSRFLCAYLVLNNVTGIPEIKQLLSRKLPVYMIPSYFITMENFPLTANNKIDIKNLPAPETAMKENAEPPVKPGNEIEKAVAGIWESVLEKQAISINDNFFETGGDSLRLIKVFNKINTAYPGAVMIASLFDSPTIKKQALLIQTALAGNKSDEGNGDTDYTVIKF